MDDALKKRLILIAAIFIAVIALYYLASPYHNCIRSTDIKKALQEDAVPWCTKFTRW